MESNDPLQKPGEPAGQSGSLSSEGCSGSVDGEVTDDGSVGLEDVADDGAAGADAAFEIAASQARTRLLMELEEAAVEAAREHGGAMPPPRERALFVLRRFRDDAWPKNGSEVVARVWGCNVTTVDRSVGEAVRWLQAEDAGEREAAVQEVLSRALRRSDAIFERAEQAEDRFAAPLYTASSAYLERYAKATGVEGRDRGPLVHIDQREVSHDEHAARLVDAMAEAARRLGYDGEALRAEALRVLRGE